MSQPQSFDHPGGDRDHVLERATDLDAHDIVGSVEPEVRRPELGLHALHDVSGARRDRDRRRQLTGQLRREAGAGEHGHVHGVAQLLRDDLRDAKQRVLLEPLGGADDRRAATDVRSRAPEDVPRPVRGDRGHDELGAGQRRAQIAGDGQIRRETDVGQIDGVGTARTHVGDQRGIARPQPRVVTDARQMDRERRAPASSPENRDLTNGKLLSRETARQGAARGYQPAEPLDSLTTR